MPWFALSALTISTVTTPVVSFVKLFDEMLLGLVNAALTAARMPVPLPP